MKKTTLYGIVFAALLVSLGTLSGEALNGWPRIICSASAAICATIALISALRKDHGKNGKG